MVEAFKVIGIIERDKPGLVRTKVPPADVVRSAYATLSVIQDETTTVNLGILRSKYRNKPWGDLSAAALAITLSDNIDAEKVPVAILDHEKHFEDIEEVTALRISQL